MAAGLLVGVGGCRSAKGVAPASGGPVPVALGTVSKGRLERGSIVSGKVAGAVEVNLVPKMAGKVAHVAVDVGSRVQAGQVVVQLEANELAAAVAQAEAALAAAQSAREQAQAELARAQAALEQARTSFTLAQANLQRGEFLLQQGAISQADFETKFQTPYVNAEAGLRQAEAAYEAAKERAGGGTAAQVAQAEAALRLARANYANSMVTSPISGVVTARYVDPGEAASPAGPVITVVQMDPVVVEVGVGETLVNRLQVGQEAAVRITAARSEPYTGRVKTVSPGADPRTKTYQVKVEIPNPDGTIKPGMFAEVDFGGQAEEVLLVPRDAVVTRDGKTVVFTVVDGKAVAREVEVGESDGRNVAVKAGLSEGEQIVVSGQDRLSDGTPVTVAGGGQ
ncbi:MAG: efflux RND transporter periplasmic adaptor subunit [Firmicutes bacterium]|nr:efflux RND transporter periplasmic adaptor subunit [Bacillota bacterium]